MVQKHLGPAIGHARLKELRPTDVLDLLSKARRSGLSPRSVQYIHAVLRSALTTAESLELVERNAARQVRSVRSRPKAAHPLSTTEIRQLLGATSEKPSELLYKLAITMGMRLGELLGLEWRDVKLSAKRVEVRQSVQRFGGRLQVVPTKQGRGRSIALSESSTLALMDLRPEVPGESGGCEDCHVFQSQRDGPLEPRNVLRRFHRDLGSAGVGRRRFHDLRHTCATLLLEAGVHHRVVMEILGHSSISTTLDLYSHVSVDLQRDAVAAMDRVLEPR